MAYDAHPVVGELASGLYAEPQLGKAITAAEREAQLDIILPDGRTQREIDNGYLVAGAGIVSTLTQVTLNSMCVPFVPYGFLGGCVGGVVGFAVVM